MRGVGLGRQGGLHQRQHTRPVRQRQVVFVVHGPGAADLHGGLRERQRHHARHAQLGVTGRPALFRAARQGVVHDGVERGALLGVGVHFAQPPEDHRAAVVHGVVHGRARQHQPVHARGHQAHLGVLGAAAAQQRVAHGAVQVERVVDAREHHGQRHGRRRGHVHVGAVAEEIVERLTVGHGPHGPAVQRGAGRGRERRQLWGVSSMRLNVPHSWYSRKSQIGELD
jgi:hypothetical protein